MPIPNFLSIETEEFNPETYVAPPYSTAATSLCWRRDPNDTSLQSNARIIRWQDGSLTLQLASSPKEQYPISIKPLVSPNKSGEYDPKLDSHVYLGAAAEASSVFLLTSHVTHGLTIHPTAVESDDAVLRLQESLAAAARGGKKTADGSAPVIEVKEDPELAKKQAELAEREKMKAERRRQQLAERDLERGHRIHAKERLGGSGLTVGGLEEDDDTLGARSSTRKSRNKKQRSRVDFRYADDDEYDRRDRTREDEYDEDDGFLVGSDEEPETFEDEDNLGDEDLDAEGEEEEATPSKKQSREGRRSESRDADEDEE